MGKGIWAAARYTFQEGGEEEEREGEEKEGEKGGGERPTYKHSQGCQFYHLSLTELLSELWGLPLQGTGKFWQQQSGLELLSTQLLEKAGNRNPSSFSFLSGPHSRPPPQEGGWPQREPPSGCTPGILLSL